MEQAERERLIAARVMDDESDMYPRICECCGDEFAVSEPSAKRCGWRLGWDGWICPKCNAPNQTAKRAA